MILKQTAVYDTYWYFAAERQEIFFRRQTGSKPPFTDDKILRDHSFTNAYRASDRVSQYLIRNVIYNGDYSPKDTIFRVLLFKLFNSVNTWELLQESLGSISFKNFDIKKYDEILTNALKNKLKIYSSAYIMPSGTSKFGSSRKHKNHLWLIEYLFNDKIDKKIAKTRTLKELYECLLSYPTIGPFLAFQYAIDINYSELVDFDESEFVVAGPGAIGGISKCFKENPKGLEQKIIKRFYEEQEDQFISRELDFKDLWGRRLQLIDIQNLFCEVDKYARVKHPHITGSSNRTRIKRKFSPNLNPIDYWFPPKWNINSKIGTKTKAIV